MAEGEEGGKVDIVWELCRVEGQREGKGGRDVWKGWAGMKGRVCV